MFIASQNVQIASLYLHNFRLPIAYSCSVKTLRVDTFRCHNQLKLILWGSLELDSCPGGQGYPHGSYCASILSPSHLPAQVTPTCLALAGEREVRSRFPELNLGHTCRLCYLPISVLSDNRQLLMPMPQFHVLLSPSLSKVFFFPPFVFWK